MSLILMIATVIAKSTHFVHGHHYSSYLIITECSQNEQYLFNRKCNGSRNSGFWKQGKSRCVAKCSRQGIE